MTQTFENFDRLTQNSDPINTAFNELTVPQARVFACLIEKHLATPKNYPLTINSLMLACNQKSNRHPVMSLTEGEVGHLSNELVELEMAKVEYGERANKVTHLAMRALDISREQAAVLCMLILREPLTLNDIKARTEKMVGFADATAVVEVVETLINREHPLVILLPKTTGRREDRYTHLLCGEVNIEDVAPKKLFAKNVELNEITDNKISITQDARIDALEKRLAAIEEKLKND